MQMDYSATIYCPIIKYFDLPLSPPFLSDHDQHSSFNVWKFCHGARWGRGGFFSKFPPAPPSYVTVEERTAFVTSMYREWKFAYSLYQCPKSLFCLELDSCEITLAHVCSLSYCTDKLTNVGTVDVGNPRRPLGLSEYFISQLKLDGLLVYIWISKLPNIQPTMPRRLLWGAGAA